jgi:hypothetical protein
MGKTLPRKEGALQVRQLLGRRTKFGFFKPEEGKEAAGGVNTANRTSKKTQPIHQFVKIWSFLYFGGVQSGFTRFQVTKSNG